MIRYELRRDTASGVLYMTQQTGSIYNLSKFLNRDGAWTYSNRRVIDLWVDPVTVLVARNVVFKKGRLC